MNKSKLDQNVTENMAETKEALQTLYDNINQGQQKQIIKREDIKALFDRYGVNY